jgi:protease I
MLVRGFMEHDKPVASICHGPLLLIQADVVRGRTLTSNPKLQSDVRDAGGSWVDRQVIIDQKLITSRSPADLPAFCSALIATFSNAIQERALDKMVEQTFPASDPLPGPSAI